MNIQTAINELTVKDQHAIAQDDKHDKNGDFVEADRWCGKSVAYAGSIQLLEGALASSNPDIEALLQDITDRGDTAERCSQEKTDPSSRAHDEGIAAGSRDVVSHLKSSLYASVN